MNELLGPAAPDFSDPLGLLRACHDRILRHVDTLLAIADHVEQHGVDAEVRKAAGNVYRYFTSAGRHHHADEEKDIFPHLARQSLRLAELVYTLRRQHEEMDAAWAEQEPLLERPAGIGDPAAFKALVQRFAELYREHIRQENEELLEMARHIFSAAQLEKIGRSMAQRRGVRPGF